MTHILGKVVPIVTPAEVETRLPLSPAQWRMKNEALSHYLGMAQEVNQDTIAKQQAEIRRLEGVVARQRADLADLEELRFTYSRSVVDLTDGGPMTIGQAIEKGHTWDLCVCVRPECRPTDYCVRRAAEMAAEGDDRG